MYHGIEKPPSVISVPPTTFAQQMNWLHESGHQVVPLSRLIQHLRHQEPLPERPVVLTFDDGLESVYTRAFPVLARYGFPATIFLVPGYCGGWNDWPSQPSIAPRLPLMTWDQVREMERHGMEFGAHTLTHPRLDRLSPGDGEYEILGSKSSIEENLGHSVEVFAYPYGRYNHTSKEIVQQAFAGACATRLGLVGRGSDPFALERIDAYYVMAPLWVKRLSSPWFSLYLGLRRPLRTAASAILRREWN
jgi:peptidoglycan/xylan/chitin deacetylase (PgdA/CDA1 family)